MEIGNRLLNRVTGQIQAVFVLRQVFPQHRMGAIFSQINENQSFTSKTDIQILLEIIPDVLAFLRDEADFSGFPGQGLGQMTLRENVQVGTRIFFLQDLQ